MARTKTESGIELHTTTDEEAANLTALSSATDEKNRNGLAINQQFGLEPFNQERVEAEIALCLTQVNHLFWETGIRLIQIKENLQHGDFLQSLARLDIARRTATGLMRGALKYANGQSLAHLTQAANSKTKLLELAFLDDDDLQALNDGETVAGLTLDDVERMTTRELKAALRKTRADAEESLKIKDNIIATKDKRLNEMDEKLASIQLKKQAEPKPAPVFKPVGTDELDALQKLTIDINAKIGAELHIALDKFYAAFGGLADVPRPMRLAAAQSIGLLLTTLNDVSDFFLITPETEPEHAAQDPALADYNAFMAWQANGGEAQLAEQLAEFDQRMAAANTAVVEDAEWKPIDKPISEWTNDDWTAYEQHGQAHDIREHFPQQDDED